MEHKTVFVKRLAYSDVIKELVAAHLESKDYDVTCHATMPLRPERETWLECADSGDMHVNGKRIEVKGRNFAFKATPWWKYESVLVCSCESQDRAEREGIPPYAYINVDLPREHVAVVLGYTRPQWKIKQKVYDSAYGYAQDCWVVGLEHVFFANFSELDQLLFL